jgi:hypothetical protein
MHFDPRTQDALREVGLDTDQLREASERIAEAVAADAATLESFFADHDTVYSDMDMAHSAGDTAEHALEYLDLYTHGADMRGYLRFDTWGVSVEGGRPLSETTVELSLGPTVHERVRFATDPAEL